MTNVIKINMTTQQFLDNIESTYETALAIVQKKNKDYAGQGDPFKNFNSSNFVGVSPERAILVRMMDKMSRISNLLEREEETKDEKIEDTIVDIINYGAILKAFLEKTD